jgi:hypothetical protein
MAVPYTFGTATAAIPLSQLDSNFATAITIGNTAVQLGNTITALANVSLVNATVTSLASPITAAQGGTGLATLTSNNVVLGNGTGNVLLVAPGTSGNALVSNGTTWSSSAVSANVSTVTGVLPIANGGTGLTTTPANGALDIGNGTGFTRTTLTAGTGITVTNASGAITIAASGSVSAATPTALGTVYGSMTTSGGTPYLTALGYNAGLNNTGAQNTAVGVSALQANTSGIQNTAFGYVALSANTTGAQNVAIGSNALGANTVATDNVAIGHDAAKGQVNGGLNVALGTKALEINSNGDNNVAIGYQAVKNSTSGRRNICLGQNSAPTITSGSYNTIIGADADTSSSTAQYQIAIGDNAIGKGNNTAFIGGTSGAYNGANSATWSVTSDARIKKNIVNVENALSVITALRPVEFDYKENDKHEVGFIAQEYQTVLPDQVAKHAANKAQKEMVGGDEVFGIQQNLVPYLVKALQELNAKFDAYVATHP